MRGILYCHGRGNGFGFGDAYEVVSAAERAALIHYMVDRGHVVLSCDLGGNATWGNGTAVARIATAIDYLLTLPNVAAGKVAIVGQSMGALNALNYVADFKTKVTSVSAIIPVVNLTRIHSDNQNNFAAEIAAAHGGAYSEAVLGATRNPLTRATNGNFGTMPVQLWYGATDTLVIPSDVAAFGGFLPKAKLYPLAGGHAESTVGLIDHNTFADFVATAQYAS